MNRCKVSYKSRETITLGIRSQLSESGTRHLPMYKSMVFKLRRKLNLSHCDPLCFSTGISALRAVRWKGYLYCHM
ncbi:hypothetical protein P8452_59997 [Trifolium repens]|nr:hypothetical protein P8452_59997 [Trifolium repens]